MNTFLLAPYRYFRGLVCFSLLTLIGIISIKIAPDYKNISKSTTGVQGKLQKTLQVLLS